MGARLRPRFELVTTEAPSELLERAARRLKARDCAVCGIVTSDRIELHVPSERQHLWSPELRVSVEPNEGGTLLVGLYGPHPHVWTLYVGIYAGIVFAAFVTFVFAFAQWTMGTHLLALYALGPLAMLALGAHGLAYVGQGLGSDQMDELRTFLESVVSEARSQDTPVRSGVRVTDAMREPSVRRAG